MTRTFEFPDEYIEFHGYDDDRLVDEAIAFLYETDLHRAFDVTVEEDES